MDARLHGCIQRGCDRCAPAQLPGQSDAEVAQADLAGCVHLCQRGDLLLAQPDVHFALQQGDGGGRGALGTHLGFHIPGEGEVVRVGQAVGDHSRFQRHNRQTQVERLQQVG